ncbi:hypothetical protein DFH28DRAFT_910936, partial [Melampsora americana]
LKPTVPKYENYNPKVPINLTILNPGSISFPCFKLKVFRACEQKLPYISETLSTAWFAKAVNIQGFINGSRKHKAKKLLINDTDSLREFMAATQAVPASTPMGFKIHHENPKDTANASRFMRNLGHSRGSGGNKPPSDDTEPEPCSEDTVGSDILSPGKRKLCILMEQFSKDFKRGENVTSVVNPQDPSLCMLLNTSRIRTWANDWANEVPGVDEVNPLMKRPGFRWIPVAHYEKEKSFLLGLGAANTPDPLGIQGLPTQGTVVHHNYYGQLFPAPGFAAAQLPFPPLYSHKFLNYAGIKPEMTKTCKILAEQGIDTFGRLLDRKTYNFENFRSMGIAFAHADDLTKAVPKFNNHLKALGSQGGSLLSS